MGVTSEEDLDAMLPNCNNFPKLDLFIDQMMFKDGLVPSYCNGGAGAGAGEEVIIQKEQDMNKERNRENTSQDYRRKIEKCIITYLQSHYIPVSD